MARGGWLVFPLWIYWFAGIKPIWDNLTAAGTGRLNYLEQQRHHGDASSSPGSGVVIYIVMKLVQRSKGVDTAMLFAEIPPD